MFVQHIEHACVRTHAQTQALGAWLRDPGIRSVPVVALAIAVALVENAGATRVGPDSADGAPAPLPQ